jgi:hypothetical protein
MIMRKSLILLSLIFGLTIGAHAQQCLTDSGAAVTTLINVDTNSLAFFTPSSDSLPCIPTGWVPYIQDTLYFTAFSTLNGFNVDSMTIDSINNLPPGLCWSSNSPDNTFAGGQNGAISISGQIAAYPGQYKLVIWASATTDIVPINNFNLERDLGVRYYIRVACPSQSCPDIDTIGGKDSLYIPYPSTCDVGIDQVSGALSNVSVQPNPFSSNAIVTFNSNIEGTFTLKMMDLLGEVVSTKEINVVHASNQTTIERNGLSSGMYLLSISNGAGSVTRKVVIY